MESKYRAVYVFVGVYVFLSNCSVFGAGIWIQLQIQKWFLEYFFPLRSLGHKIMLQTIYLLRF